MPLFDKLTKPDDPKSYYEPVYGAVPAIVVSLDDPEKLGRVQVIEPTTGQLYPNGKDGWVAVATTDAVPDGYGGTQHYYEVGMQVKMIADYGDPTKMTVFCVVHSRVDRPSPEMDRPNGIYGSATKGGKIELHDDPVGRSVKTYANGYTQKVSPDGTYTMQTADGGRLQLQKDGTIITENGKCSTCLSPDGGFESRNNRGGSLSVLSTGDVSFAVDAGTKITLSNFGLTTDGQKDPEAIASSTAKKQITGALNASGDLVTRLKALAEEMKTALPEDRYRLLGEAGEVIKLLEEAFIPLPEAKQTLDKIIGFSQEKLGKHVMGEIDQLREDYNIEELAKLFAAGINTNDIQGETIIEQIRGIVSPAIASKLRIDPKQLEEILRALAHDPEKQFEAILDQVVDGGIARVQSVISRKLADKIGDFGLKRNIEDLLDNELFEQLKDIGLLASGKLPSNIKWQDFVIKNYGADSIIAQDDEKNPLSDFMKSLKVPTSVVSAIGISKQLKGMVSQVTSIMGKLKGKISSVSSILDKLLAIKEDMSKEIAWGEQPILLAQQLRTGVASTEDIAPAIADFGEFVDAVIKIQSIDDYAELARIPDLLKKLDGHFDVANFRSRVTEPDYIFLDDLDKAIADLVEDVIQEAIPNFISEIESRISNGLLSQSQTAIQLFDTLSENTKGGITRSDGNSTLISSSTNRLGGEFEVNNDFATLSGPRGRHGFGSQIVADKDKITQKAPGSDLGTGSFTTVDPKTISFFAPGAVKDLGSSAFIDQETIIFNAPGGQKEQGSQVAIDQSQINLYAAGGQKGLGSKITVEPMASRLDGPGGAKDIGASFEANALASVVYAPGGRQGKGCTIPVTPNEIGLITPLGPSVIITGSKAKKIDKIFRISPEKISLEHGGHLEMDVDDIDVRYADYVKMIGGSSSFYMDDNEIEMRVGGTTVLVNSSGFYYNGDRVMTH